MSNRKNEQVAHQLAERVKELQCLYGIATIAQGLDSTLEERYQAILNLLPASWQYPEVTCAKLVINEREFKTSNFQETLWRLSSNVKIRGDKAGILEISYLDKKPKADKGPFLKQEAYLLDSVAKWLGTITEQTQAGEELKRNKQELQIILDSVPGYIFYRDKGGRHVLANRAVAEATGIPAKEWVGKTVDDLFPNLAEAYRADDREVIIADKPKRNIIEPMETAHGRRWLQTDKIPYKDKDGNTLGIIGCAYDITERKQAEEALEKKQQELKTILDSAPAQIFYKDTKGKFIFVNKALARVLGVPAKNWVGKTMNEIFPDSKHDFRRADRKVIAKNKSKSGIIEPMHTPQGIRWLKTDKMPKRDEDGKVIGIIGFSIDITEQKQAEERALLFQKRLSSLVSRLSSTEERERRQLAEGLHDGIGQVLSLIRFRLHSLDETASSREIRRDLEQIKQLVDGAIKSTRSLTFNLTPPILYELGLEAALEWLIEQYNEKTPIQHYLKITGEGEASGYELRSLLFQAARELLANALKHSRAKKVEVSLRQGSGKLQLVVKDDGVGFSPSEIDAKHQCFGLFNMRERLKDIRGQFSLESSAGNGTCITITVPSRLNSESE